MIARIQLKLSDWVYLTEEVPLMAVDDKMLTEHWQKMAWQSERHMKSQLEQWIC